MNRNGYTVCGDQCNGNSEVLYTQTYDDVSFRQDEKSILSEIICVNPCNPW